MRKVVALLLVAPVAAHVAQVEEHIADENCKANYIRYSRPACVVDGRCFPHGTDMLNGCRSASLWQWPKHAAGVNPHPRQRVTANGHDKQKHIWTYAGDITQGEAEQLYNLDQQFTVEDVLNTPMNQIAFIGNVDVEQPTGWFVPGKNNTNGCGQAQTWDLPFGFEADPVSGVVNQTALQVFQSNLQKLHQSGVTLTLTMGSWCTQFPIKPNEEWSDDMFQQFVTYFETLRSDTFGGALDGIDFDWEGFCSEECLKGECYCDWDHKECGSLSPEELADGHQWTWVDQFGSSHQKECWMMVTSSTMQVMVGIAHHMKLAGYVVTLVPMSTSMYTGDADTTPKQVLRNEFVKYSRQDVGGVSVNILDIVDGILLQWYSGFDASLCEALDDPKQCSCDNKPDDDYPNVLNVTKDGQMSAWWTTHPGIGGNHFPTTYPVRCQACGKNVLLPDGTKGDLPCASDDETWFVPAESRDPSGTSNVTAEHKTKLDNYTQVMKSIPYWWVKGTEVGSKCPRRADCPDWRYEGEEDYASQMKLLTSLSKVVDLDKVSIGFESLGIDVQVQMQAYVDPALPWTTVTPEQKAAGKYWNECTQNMTLDNIDEEKRCAKALLTSQWGLKFKASDVVGLDSKVQKVLGKELGGVGFFTVDGLVAQAPGKKDRFWFRELLRLNQTFQIPCSGTQCGASPDPSPGPAPTPPPTPSGDKYSCDWSAPWPKPPTCKVDPAGSGSKEQCDGMCHRGQIYI